MAVHHLISPFSSLAPCDRLVIMRLHWHYRLMRGLAHGLLIGNVVGLAVIGFETSVAACSCTNTGTSKQSFDASDAVFLGTVENVAWIYNPPSPTEMSGVEYYIATLRVKQAWKGVKQPIIKMYTIEGAACGYDFKAGQEYLVYANQTPKEGRWPLPVGVLTTSVCGRTSPASKFNLDSFIREFGPGTPIADRHKDNGAGR